MITRIHKYLAMHNNSHKPDCKLEAPIITACKKHPLISQI